MFDNENPRRWIKLSALAVLSVYVTLASGASFASVLQDENLLCPIPQGFQLGVHSGGPAEISEFVPTGETVKTWSRMLTIQIMHNLKNRNPDELPQAMTSQWTAACAGGEVSKAKDGVENGYKFSIWVFGCPLNPKTEKPENMFLKVIAGADALYVVQYAYRAPLSAEIIPPTMQLLSKVAVCDTREQDRKCPTGM